MELRESRPDSDRVVLINDVRTPDPLDEGNEQEFRRVSEQTISILRGYSTAIYRWSERDAGQFASLAAEQHDSITMLADTFPWPQTPTKGLIAEVVAAVVALRALRREIMGKLGYSLRALYRTLEEPGADPLREAHTRLDTALRAAYAMHKAADPLAFLLALNLALAAKEKAANPITPPSLPLPEAERIAFITGDCVPMPD